MKVSVVIPCLWTDQKYIDMTFKCISSMGDVGQIIVVGNQESYAENVNAGLRATKNDIIIVCNNDIEFIQPDWLDHLLKPLDEYDITSIRTSDSDGWDVEDKYEPDGKFGSIWAMKRLVYETIGGLDETFGNYFEDLDYHKRATDVGFKVVKNHAGIVQHQGKATFHDVDPEDAQFLRARDKFKDKWGKVW